MVLQDLFFYSQTIPCSPSLLKSGYCSTREGKGRDVPGGLLLDAQTTAGAVEVGTRPVFIQRAAKQRKKRDGLPVSRDGSKSEGPEAG